MAILVIKKKKYLKLPPINKWHSNVLIDFFLAKRLVKLFD